MRNFTLRWDHKVVDYKRNRLKCYAQTLTFILTDINVWTSSSRAQFLVLNTAIERWPHEFEHDPQTVVLKLSLVFEGHGVPCQKQSSWIVGLLQFEERGKRIKTLKRMTKRDNFLRGRIGFMKWKPHRLLNTNYLCIRFRSTRRQMHLWTDLRKARIDEERVVLTL